MGAVEAARAIEPLCIDRKTGRHRICTLLRGLRLTRSRNRRRRRAPGPSRGGSPARPHVFPRSGVVPLRGGEVERPRGIWPRGRRRARLWIPRLLHQPRRGGQPPELRRRAVRRPFELRRLQARRSRRRVRPAAGIQSRRVTPPRRGRLAPVAVRQTATPSLCRALAFIMAGHVRHHLQVLVHGMLRGTRPAWIHSRR